MHRTTGGGTKNAQTINHSIYDFKNDSNLGKVNFVPFLTDPNPQAIPNSNSPTSTPSPIPSQTQNPTPSLTPSPSIPEFSTWIILLVLVAFAILAFVGIKRKRLLL